MKQTMTGVISATNSAENFFDKTARNDDNNDDDDGNGKSITQSTYQLDPNSSIFVNYNEFICDLNNLVTHFRETGNVFKLWISISLGFNGVVFLFFFISIWSQWLSSFDKCTSLNYLSLSHWFLEFLFFFVSLLLALEAMAYNHRILHRFNIHFVKRIVVGTHEYDNYETYDNKKSMDEQETSGNVIKENAKIKREDTLLALEQQKRIIKHLEYLVHVQSPFRFWSLTPTYSNLTRLLVITFITIAYNVAEVFISIQ